MRFRADLQDRPPEVFLTVDVEPDCPPYLHGWRGVTEGLPRLLDLMADEQVATTCFVTGQTAERFPDAIRELVDAGHELGCHGHSHGRFGAMDRTQAELELAKASAVLRRFGPTTAFRAPNLDLPDAFLPLLVEAGFGVDSSEGYHRLDHRVRRADPYPAQDHRPAPAASLHHVVGTPAPPEAARPLARPTRAAGGSLPPSLGAGRPAWGKIALGLPRGDGAARAGCSAGGDPPLPRLRSVLRNGSGLGCYPVRYLALHSTVGSQPPALSRARS